MRTPLLTLLFAAGLVLPLSAALDQPVKTKIGKLQGAPGRDPSVTVFKGIPYAAPPVGEQRWRAPAPPIPWKGIRQADAFGPSAMQSIVPERKPWTHEFMTQGDISEDCLTLNVWTAAQSAREQRPVYVYIHGGAFTEGSGRVPVYDGEGLAKKGLVVVTINYRLGVVGFLAHPELSRESASHTSGNYGLLDVIAALRWVHENIRAFGGDPGRVTIGGQSAGGMAVHSMIASPLAKGLFHRAIVESGGSSASRGRSGFGPRSLAEAEADGAKFADLRGAKSLAALRAMTWAQLTAPASAEAGQRTPPLRFSPIVDGYVLPAAPAEVVAQGRQNDVPILTGANLGELGGFGPPPASVTAEAFAQQAQARYGEFAGRFLELYPATGGAEARQALEQSNRDQALASLYIWSRQRARTAKTPAFLYLWDHTLPGPDAAQYGAFHTSEVPYFMNTLDRSDRPFVEADHRIADRLSSYVAHFVATGDPNGAGLPAWAPAGDEPVVMEVGDKNEPVTAASNRLRYEFFEKYFNGGQ